MYSRIVELRCSCYVRTRVYTPRHPIPQEGALPGTLRSAGSDAAPAGGEGTSLAALGGPWVTVRAHYGALPSMAGRGQAKGGRKPGWMRAVRLVSWPGRTAPRSKKSPRWSAERRCRVPLFPGDPGNTPRPVTLAPFGASTSLSLEESEGPETPTHVNSFAGRDEAWPKEGAGECTSAPTHAASYAGLTRVSITLQEFGRGWIAGSSPAMTRKETLK